MRIEWLAVEKKNTRTILFADLFNIYRQQNVFDYYWDDTFENRSTIYDESLLPILLGARTEF